MNIIDDLQYLKETKNLIKQSIIDKGVEIEDDTPFRQYAEKIGELYKTVQTTQAEYDELAEKDPNTLYVIVG